MFAEAFACHHDGDGRFSDEVVGERAEDDAGFDVSY